MNTLPTLADIEAARARIAPHLPVTPVTKALTISDELKRTVHLKWDNKLRTGAFKERGALNYLLCLDSTTRARGVCTASAGNHALGLSYHASKLGVPCHIVMPASAPLVKVESCKKLGAFITLKGSLVEAMEYAQELAKLNNLTYIPPFDHPYVVHGQGVAGLELMDQLDDFDSVIIPVGGGGYAAGISTAIKAKRPDVYILGVCSEWAAEFRRNPAAHNRPYSPMTIADGIAVKSIGKVTGPILDAHVDQLVSVSEASIADAIITLLEQEHVVVEGAGAAGFAALAEGLLPPKYVKPVVMICGSNIDMNLLSRLIEQDMAERGRLLKVSIALPDRPGALHLISGIIADKGANVLQVFHDRFYARLPGHVDITVVMEVRDRAHASEIIAALIAEGLPTTQL
jgi:threonine dehydratase